MQIQVNTGHGVENSESLQRWAGEHLTATLSRFQQDIIRIEVQLNLEKSGNAGAPDKRCMMEARLAHHQPVEVNHHGDTQDEAFRGAARKLLNALEHALGKVRDNTHRDRDTIRKDVAVTGVLPGTPGTPG
jgi:ribosome-associated translation inhibitor RaiA